MSDVASMLNAATGVRPGLAEWRERLAAEAADPEGLTHGLFP